MTVLDERVAEVVREEQPATAVLASTSWLLRITTGDVRRPCRGVAILAKHSVRQLAWRPLLARESSGPARSAQSGASSTSPCASSTFTMCGVGCSNALQWEAVPGSLVLLAEEGPSLMYRAQATVRGAPERGL